MPVMVVVITMCDCSEGDVGHIVKEKMTGLWNKTTPNLPNM
jgi:hypothetical protein